MDIPFPREKILAIVLNYNGGEEVLACIHSLLRSTLKPEIILVDNASTDGSLSLLRERFPDLVFLPQEKNLGFAAGMNIGIRYGLEYGTQFFWLLNNDAVVGTEALEKLIAAAQAEKNAGLLSPAIFTPAGIPWFLGGHISYFRMRAEHVSVKKENEVFYPTEYVTGCAMLVSRAAVEKVGFLDEKYFLYYEDAAYSLSLRRAGFQVGVVPGARVIHSEKSQFNPEKTYWLVRSGMLFFEGEARGVFRLWIPFFLRMRKLKNRLDLFLSPRDRVAREVRRAYTDTSHFS